MSAKSSEGAPVRPERLTNPPLPPAPQVDPDPDQASVEYSHYRTNLSHHRTELSEHRTDLSEYRTDLSGERTQMSMRRTGMSFQRTRMSADRTLMSVIRTALSLIGFGFTLAEAFRKLHEAGVIHPAGAPRNFGLTLIVLGVLLLTGGIINHVRFAVELRSLRGQMRTQGLIFGETRFPVSLTFITAVLLFLVGIAAVLSIVFDVSLFG